MTTCRGNMEMGIEIGTCKYASDTNLEETASLTDQASVYVNYMVNDRLHAFAHPTGPWVFCQRKQRSIVRCAAPHPRAPSSTLIKRKSKSKRIDPNKFDHVTGSAMGLYFILFPGSHGLSLVLRTTSSTSTRSEDVRDLKMALRRHPGTDVEGG